MDIEGRKKIAESFERELFRVIEEKYRAADMKPTHFGRAVWGESGPRALRLLQMLLPEYNVDGTSRKRSISVVDVILICSVLGLEPSRLLWEAEQRMEEQGVKLEESKEDALTRICNKIGITDEDLGELVKVLKECDYEGES